MFVFRIVPFILILKYFVTTTYSQESQAIFNVTAAKINDTTTTITNITQIDLKKKEPDQIIGEGGVRFSTEPLTTVTKSIKDHVLDVTSTSTTTAIPTIHGREGVTIINTKKIDKNSNVKLNATEIKLKGNVTNNMQKNDTKSELENHSIENTIGINIDGKANIIRSGSVPKKGVTFTSDQLNATVATTSTTTTTIKPAITNTEKSSTMTTKVSTVQSTTIVKQIHKPTITTGSESDKDALVKQKSNNSTPKVPTIEYYQKNKEENKRSAFVIPIVAVILSVPLVAIVVNILYKRGKEWWAHRHYRRMDFLIDGMYNN